MASEQLKLHYCLLYMNFFSGPTCNFWLFHFNFCLLWHSVPCTKSVNQRIKWCGLRKLRQYRRFTIPHLPEFATHWPIKKCKICRPFPNVPWVDMSGCVMRTAYTGHHVANTLQRTTVKCLGCVHALALGFLVQCRTRNPESQFSTEWIKIHKNYRVYKREVQLCVDTRKMQRPLKSFKYIPIRA